MCSINSPQSQGRYEQGGPCLFSNSALEAQGLQQMVREARDFGFQVYIRKPAFNDCFQI